MNVFYHVGCLSLSGFDEVSVVMFEAGASLTEKAEQEKDCKMYTFSWGWLLEVKM